MGDSFFAAPARRWSGGKNLVVWELVSFALTSSRERRWRIVNVLDGPVDSDGNLHAK